ncbi:hypothetical protein Tco_1232077, partial [Tanacetum coccineum]
IWEALEGNTHDFGLIGEETGQRCNLTKGSLDLQCMETASQILLMPLKTQGDDVTIFGDVVVVADLKKAHGRFDGLTETRLEDTSSVIDHYLDGMILGKPFVKQSKHTYVKEEGTVMFEKNDERVTFKMPHRIERFKDIEDLNTDDIPPFFIASKGDEEKREGYVNRKRMTHYSKCWRRLYQMRRVRKFIEFSLGRFLDDDLTSLSRFFSDIE